MKGHRKFSLAGSIINNYMSGNLGHARHKSALIWEVFKEPRGNCKKLMSGSHLHNNVSKHALNQVCVVKCSTGTGEESLSWEGRKGCTKE